MRASFWEYFNSFAPRLSPSGLDRTDIETIFTVELFVTGCFMVDPDMTIQEGWTIMAGYDEPILPKHARVEIVHRLRVLYCSIRSRSAWEDLFELYGELPIDYRLYQINEERWEQHTPTLYADRKNWYECLLQQPVDHVRRDIHFASVGDFYYYKYNHEQEPIRYAGEIPFVPVNVLQFPRYRNKGKFQLHLEDGNVRPSLSMREASGSSEWNDRGSIEIRLKSLLDPSLQVLNYEGTQHIVGGLGTGKSTFMLIETERLVQEGAKIGFIENSVPQALNRVRELRQIGIKAVPVIGKSSRKKHQKDFLSARQHMIRDVSDWGTESQHELKHLSDFCIIRALVNDDDGNSDYPCRKLIQNIDQKCVCPYASECGVYKDYTDLIEADVWVTTSASILRTKLPVMLDPYERTVYEAMYDLLDIVFVDEADAVQKQFDDSFLTEIALFGNSQHLFEKALLESLRKTIGQYGKFARDAVVQEWMDVLNRLERTIRRGVYRKLNRSPEYAQFLQRKLIRLSTEAYRISGAFSENEQDQSRIKEILQAFADNPLEHSLSGDVEKLLDAKSMKSRTHILSQIVKKINGLESPRGKYKYPMDSLEFYLYLSLVDYDMRAFMELYLLVQAKLGSLSDFDGLYSVQREFTPILKEAMTGIMTGYLYDVKPGSASGTFKTVQYTGVGRLLLHEWYSIYQGVDGYAGPSVVLLSGTSLAPGSAHYHIDAEPGWVLESNLEAPVIHQEFYPVYEKWSDKPLTVSGGEDEQRSRNLRMMTSKLLPKIEQELMEWRYDGSQRRVLLIVNSYEDVDDVAGVLGSMPSWATRYRQLDRDPDPYHEAEFSRSELERFANEKADVLIAPLLAISRGYNILDETKGSLFGSVFFLIRPYPIPYDMTYLIQMLHADLSDISLRADRLGIHYRQALTLLRRESNGKLHRLYHKPDFWSILKPNERKTIAWYTFVPIWQTIGRLLRKGTNARVFYCDGKFTSQPINAVAGESMMDYWFKIMKENEAKPAFRNLYGPFIDSIRRALEREEDFE